MKVFVFILGLTMPLSAVADTPRIVDARAVPQEGGWRFDVTLRHGDTGWDHYADAWSVIGPDGMVLGERVLAHPHVDEQPFTRSLSGVEIPDGTTRVLLRPRDSVHGDGPDFELELPGADGS